jgi:phenylalanyl-tRNA synthetase beta chain
MRIPLSWINELVNIENINLEELIEKLTLGGFEIEETQYLTILNQKEIVLEISTTANRADTLSIIGIAKEIAALFNLPLKASLNFNLKLEQDIKNAVITNIQSEIYSSFITIIVDNILIKDSPKWIKHKLLSSGITPSNNLLDFQKYLLLETGYPFEFYDLEKIRIKNNNFSLKLIPAKNGEKLTANNNLTYELTENIHVINLKNQLLSIGGLISNLDYQYTTSSRSILIEAAVFNSKKIRNTSRTLGLRTERSIKYEKGLTNNDIIKSVCRILSLLKFYNNALTYKIHTVAHNSYDKEPSIELKYTNILEVLGLTKKNLKQLTIHQIYNYLNSLNFTTKFDSKKIIWHVKIPSSRIADITHEIDLIEEIGRLHGFNNFDINLPKIKKIGTEDCSYQSRKKINTCFRNEGLNELFQYSLIKEEGVGIKLVNPLLSEYSELRQTLLKSLLQTSSKNVKQGNLPLQGFEFGHVFFESQCFKYIEKEYISGMFGATEIKRDWSSKRTRLSWFEGKGKIENIFDNLNLLVHWKNSNALTYRKILHPYRTAEISFVNGLVVGVFGQINPILAKQFSLPFDIYLFEFNFEVLKNQLKQNKLAIYQYYSLYPRIIKDLSFIIEKNISFERIKKLISAHGTKVLYNIELLDQYQGKNIPNNQISLCIKLTFQSYQETLLTTDIEKIMKNIEFVLLKEFNVNSRS